MPQRVLLVRRFVVPKAKSANKSGSNDIMFNVRTQEMLTGGGGDWYTRHVEGVVGENPRRVHTSSPPPPHKKK